jgi:DNA helicase-4
MINLKNEYKFLRNKVRFSFFIFINFKTTYDNLQKVIDQMNKDYVEEQLIINEEYFDKLFNYPIDEEQRRAILTDDDNNLIIAGAGSGKTTTIIGKTRFLIDKKGIDPREIITISFTRASTDSFVKKLDDDRVQCSTFHKLGKDIIEEGNFKKDIASEDLLHKLTKKYISEELIKTPEKRDRFIRLYSYHIHYNNSKDKDFGDVIEIEKGYDKETLKSRFIKNKLLKQQDKKALMTLKDEKVKSVQELVIANYLFLHGIEYEYEAKYICNTTNEYYRQYHPDFYLPEYKLYIEHFGVNKDFRAPQYSEIEEQRYLEGIKWKRQIHEQNGTRLMETYSYEFDNYGIERVLKKKLKEFGVKVKPINYDEVIETISKINSEEMASFYSLVEKFIKIFKENNFEETKFDEFYKDSVKKKNIRHQYLLEFIKDVYLYYQNDLKINNSIDFADMINLATERVNLEYNKKVSYIIIDEFQDISFSRYKLVKAIQDKTNAKVIAVGDDWQSIYRFSGCDLNLFVNFKDYFEHPKIMYITNTYRNCQNLIDFAGSFVMVNKNQIKKKLKSNVPNFNWPIEYYFMFLILKVQQKQQ